MLWSNIERKSLVRRDRLLAFLVNIGPCITSYLLRNSAKSWAELGFVGSSWSWTGLPKVSSTPLAPRRPKWSWSWLSRQTNKWHVEPVDKLVSSIDSIVLYTGLYTILWAPIPTVPPCCVKVMVPFSCWITSQFAYKPPNHMGKSLAALTMQGRACMPIVLTNASCV